MEFFNFLIKHKCANILNKEIGQCLATHPNNLNFWKIAAYNEYENNLNTFVARNLFQKCLRMNKENLQAYLDYFLFEIKFVEKILERRKILASNKEEDKLKILVDANENNAEAEKNAKEEAENSSVSDDVLNLKICEIIWRKALSAKLNNEDKISITLKFLKFLFQEKHKLGSNMKRLKQVMNQYLKENKEELMNFYSKIKKENEICEDYSNNNGIVKEEDINSNLDVVISIQIFLIKLEKIYFNCKADKEIERVRVYILYDLILLFKLFIIIVKN